MGTCVYVLLTQSYDNDICDYKKILPLGYMHSYYQTGNKDVQLTCSFRVIVDSVYTAYTHNIALCLCAFVSASKMLVNESQHDFLAKII